MVLPFQRVVGWPQIRENATGDRAAGDLFQPPSRLRKNQSPMCQRFEYTKDPPHGITRALRVLFETRARHAVSVFSCDPVQCVQDCSFCRRQLDLVDLFRAIHKLLFFQREIVLEVIHGAPSYHGAGCAFGGKNAEKRCVRLVLWSGLPPGQRRVGRRCRGMSSWRWS